jgi:hypothetical protein
MTAPSITQEVRPLRGRVLLEGGMFESVDSVRPHSKPWLESSNFEAGGSPPSATATLSVTSQQKYHNPLASILRSSTPADTIMSLTGYMIERIKRGFNTANPGRSDVGEQRP